jgi:hypothetical protein
VLTIAFGVLFVGAGVFLWRRPHALTAVGPHEAPGDAEAIAGDAGAHVEAGAGDLEGPVALSDVRVVACHDRGPKKTLPSDCDRPAGLEQAVSRAIEHSATCIPPGVPSATIEYVVDLSFARHVLHVGLPRAGRTVRDRKVVEACATAVRESLPASSIDGMAHEHSRYKLAVTATYRPHM